MTYRALIVDDEPLARRSIRCFLDRSEGFTVVAECGDGESALEAVRQPKPDLIFLDVQMPEMSGFDVVRAIGAEAMPVVIFVTAYDQYALKAFDANAVDYLLKPFSKERFARALDRARERLTGKLRRYELRRLLRDVGALAPKQYAERLTVAENGRILLINVGEVDWISARGNYAQVHAGRRHYEIRQTLTHLQQKLNPREFTRIHRSTIVNIRRIREIQPWFHGHHLVVLQDGQELRMSRYQREVAKKLGIV